MSALSEALLALTKAEQRHQDLRYEDVSWTTKERAAEDVEECEKEFLEALAAAEGAKKEEKNG